MFDFLQGYMIPLFCGKSGRKTKKKIASFKNNFMFQNIFSRLAQDALMRYKFNGLPETVSERALLQSLLWYGCVCFFEWEGGIFALPAAPTGSFNIYGDPKQAFVFSRNSSIGFNKEIDLFIPGSDENAFLNRTDLINISSSTPRGVLVWENALRYPFINQTIFFSEAIADSMRTLDVCRVNLKNPYLIVAEESVVPTVKRYFEQRDNNETYILSSGIFDAAKVQILPVVTSSDTLAACSALVEWYEAKYRELCGVKNNSQIDKKGENLIQAEISVNDDYTFMGVDKSVKYIQDGLDIVNRIWGLSITVEEREKDVNIFRDETEDADIRGDNGSDTRDGTDGA